MYDNQLIYDVGFHNGDDTAYYLSKGYNVIAIEADPVQAEQGREKFKKYIDTRQLKILNVGVAVHEGEFEFYVNEIHPEWNSFDLAIASREGLPYHSIKIETKTFRSILRENGIPYYLKVDIEGNDFLCIQGLDRENLPKFISVEGNSISLLEELAAKGFTKYKLIWQYNFALLEIPVNKFFKYWMWSQKLRNWNSLPIIAFRKFGGVKLIQLVDKLSVPKNNRHFPRGSSGDFAQNLEGKWYSQKEAEHIYNYYEKKYSLSGSKKYGFWVDIHATW